MALLKCSCFAVVLAAYAIIQLIISVKETSLVPQSLRRSPTTALEGAWERDQKETGARLRKTGKNIYYIYIYSPPIFRNFSPVF